MHDEKIAKNAFEDTLLISNMLENVNQFGINENLVGIMLGLINNFMGTHVYEIIKNQKDPSIIGLSIEINNLLCDQKFLNNFKSNEIGDRIAKIQNYILKEFPHVMDGLNPKRVKRQKE